MDRESDKAKNQEFVLSTLLADYGERNNDYRRYLKLELTIWYTVAAIVTGYAAQVWTSNDGDRYWLYLIGAGVIALALPLHYFIHRLSEFILTYLMEIELSVNTLVKAAMPDRGEPVFGYYVSKWVRSKRLYHRLWRFLLFLIVLAVLVPLQWVMVFSWMLQKPVLQRLKAIGVPTIGEDNEPVVATTALVSVLAVASIGLIYLGHRRNRITRDALILKQSSPIRPNHSGLETSTYLEKALQEDFKQRSEDARFLMDNYKKILIFDVVALAAVIGFWLTNPSVRWPWLLVPPVLLIAVSIKIYNSYVLQQGKRWLEKTELDLDSLATKSGASPTHSYKGKSFSVGFFAIIRKEEIQPTGSAKVPIRLVWVHCLVVIAVIGLVILSWYLGSSALELLFPTLIVPSIAYFSLIMTAVAALAGLYLGTGTGGRDDPK